MQTEQVCWLEFTVSDTGPGIPQDFLDTVFDKFRQMDSSATRSYGGVGLGLYIAKKYAHALGGSIKVDSAPRQGSTFTVTIPCRKVTAFSNADCAAVMRRASSG